MISLYRFKVNAFFETQCR